MLSLLVAHIIITVSCLWGGFLFYKFLPGKIESRPIIFYLVSGLILFTFFTQIIVLFYPIDLAIQLVFAVALLVTAFFRRTDLKNLYKKVLAEYASWPKLTLLVFFLTWFIVLLINAGPTIMDDTESYHIQSIKWIQEYGSVPGLVNLHERFGFNSSWFSSVALFSFSPTTTGGFTVLNSVLSMWLCCWFISKYIQFQKENNVQAAFAILVIFIAALMIWPLIRGNAATTNYDFITTCMVLILFTEIFFLQNKEISPSIEWVIWPAYLFTVRLINFPLLLLSLIGLIFFIKQKNLKALFLPVAYSLLLIIPFVIRNIMITGFPFYPATYFDFITVDWKPDPQVTERLLEYIKYYNRVSTTYLDIEQTKALGAAWIPAWFRHLFLFDKILLLLSLIGVLLTSTKLFIQKHNYNKSILLITVMIAWLICWFIVSPDPRFVYGILLFGVFLLAYYSASIMKNFIVIKVLSNTLIIVLVAGSGFYLVSKPLKQPAYRNWISPVKLPEPPVQKIVVDGITFKIPEAINNNWNARCYGTDLPCLYKIDPRLKLRGKNISSGFRLGK